MVCAIYTTGIGNASSLQPGAKNSPLPSPSRIAWLLLSVGMPAPMGGRFDSALIAARVRVHRRASLGQHTIGNTCRHYRIVALLFCSSVQAISWNTASLLFDGATAGESANASRQH